MARGEKSLTITFCRPTWSTATLLTKGRGLFC